MPKKDRIYHDGVCLSRIACVAEAAIGVASGIAANERVEIQRLDLIANDSLNIAETIWDELCSRFPSDEDEVDE